MASIDDIHDPEIVMELFRSSGGIWSIPDTTLRMVWNKIERLGLEEIFYPILIENAEEFIRLCKRDTHGLFFLRRGNDFLLLSSLLNPGPGHIWVRFCPLELPYSIDLVLATERFIKSWFAAAEGAQGPKVLISAIPEVDQKIELAFIGELGFKTIGKIPGMIQMVGQRCMAGIFSYRDRA